MAMFSRSRRSPRDGLTPLDTGWATAAGPRPDNQDRCLVTERFAVLSDGAGGHAGGARAAELAVAAVAGALGAGHPLEHAVAEADAAVRAARAAQPELAAMAATLTAAAACGPGPGAWLVANVGDSPAWHVGAGITRLTSEHNVAAELVRAGALTPEQARAHPGRHQITRAIGAGGAEADLRPVSLGPGEALVLASDGIEVLDEAMVAAVVTGAAGAQAAADDLVAAALQRGAADNVTAVVLHLPSFPHGPGVR